jgi:hypothetical protein
MTLLFVTGCSHFGSWAPKGEGRRVNVGVYTAVTLFSTDCVEEFHQQFLGVLRLEHNVPRRPLPPIPAFFFSSSSQW